MLPEQEREQKLGRAGGQGQSDCGIGTAMSVALTVEALLPPVPTMPQGKHSAQRQEFAQALHGDIEHSLLFFFFFYLSLVQKLILDDVNLCG